MALPIVAIVGRPNVGKSSLLNALAGRLISIVDPTAGVTRDRISTVVELNGKFFELVDTGGYGIEDVDNLTDHIEAQIELAINQARLVLFIVDVKEGVAPLDEEVARLLRQKKLDVLLVANKADTPAQENLTGELFKLGFGEPLCISALHGRNRDGLVEAISERLGDIETAPPPAAVMKFAVVGKRNVGKSTFINALAGEERVIVSEVPGTTRDSVDVRFEKDGHSYIAIDTAGVRKRAQMMKKDIEFYSYHRAQRSIRRADVVFLFLDAVEEISMVDKQLAKYIAEQLKPCILVVNKWDLAKDRANSEDYAEYFNKVLPGLDYAPISFITAKDAKNIQSLLDLAQQLYKQAGTMLSTSQLNQAIETIMAGTSPTTHQAGLPKIYYGTQVAAHPPTLLLFVNRPSLIDESYRRFLINRFRVLLPFAEVPIRLLVRGHRSTDKDPDRKSVFQKQRKRRK